MAIATIPELIAVLRQYQLLTPEQLDEAASHSEDAGTLAQRLHEIGWLTPYQVQQLLAGKGQELVLGSYLVLERLGAGGMGQVFKARHRGLDKIVALKLIHKERLDNPQAVKRFHREIEAAAKLNHPNVVVAYDADQVGDTHFFTMEHVDGADLAKIVKERGPLPVALACDYMRQAAIGLQHAHEHGLVHRDIKPHNLLVTAPPIPREGGKRAYDPPALGTEVQPERPSPGSALRSGGVVKILDMGLARVTQADSADRSSTSLTQEGSVMGTPDYIAPEQARESHTVDIRADLYSLGCTFYFVLTGAAPFAGGTLIQKMNKHQFAEPTPVEQVRPEVPAAVAEVVRKLMAKKPEDRYQTPAGVAAALAALLAGGGTSPLAPVLRGEGTGVRGEVLGEGGIGNTAPGWSSVVQRPDTAEELASPYRQRQEAEDRRWRRRNLVGAGILLALIVVVALVAWRPWEKPGANKPPTPIPTIPPPSKGGEAIKMDKQIVNSIGMRLAYIPAGEFMMGSPETEPQRDKNEGPQHKVKITKAFYMGAYEVKQGEYEKVMGKNPSRFKEEGPDNPVEQVIWDEAVEFCKKLSELPEEKKAGRVYRLPTEAEWEYACRAGTTTVFHYGDSLSSKQANFHGNNPYGGAEKGPYLGKTVKVGSYKPNAWGLYDMHGNVWEWCLDGPRDYPKEPGKEPIADPKGPEAAGGSRVLRGGCYHNEAFHCRSARRLPNSPSNRYSGFRCVLVRWTAVR